MSARRPGLADNLAREIEEMCRIRAMSEADFVAVVTEKQRALDAAEAPRALPGMAPCGAGGIGVLERSEGGDLREELNLDDVTAERLADEMSEARAEVHAQRVLHLCVKMLRRVVAANERRPKLVGFLGLFALGADCESMRAVASAYGLTPERVSQMAEELRVTFGLPKNQHNKSDRAVGSYRRAAQGRGTAA